MRCIMAKSTVNLLSTECQTRTQKNKPKILVKKKTKIEKKSKIIKQNKIK